MVTKQDYNPLTESVPPEVHLDRAPLIRVISQVRFPIIVSIEKRDFIGGFQEAIRDTYPVLRPEQTQGIFIGPKGIEPTPSQVTWRFSDIDEKWKVSLAPEFLALETTSYTSRSEFLDRLRVVLESLNIQVGPKIIDRLGIRYIDRITGEQLADMGKLVRREVLGVLSTQLASSVQQTLSESVFALPDNNARILARWGRLPENATPDPGAIEPIPDPSWILDIDMFSSLHTRFDPQAQVTTARMFSERIYALFRWIVTDEFIRQYGGNV